MSAQATLRELSAPVPRGAFERDQLFERLQNLRAILPVFATELAEARRQAAQLRVENRKLKEQLGRLQDERRTGSVSAARRQLKARLETVARRPLDPADTIRA